MRAPTGEQFEIVDESGGAVSRAVVTEVGAGLRELTVGGVDIAEPYPAESTPPSGAGCILVPWPNRIRDGAWSLDGERQQLALTEPDRRNAIHGLLRHSAYRLVRRAAGSVTLGATVFPQPGYPFLLDTTVGYALDAGGLTVTHRISNAGPERAPAAIGAHPYLKIGGVPTGDLTLRMRAGTHFVVDERMNVVGAEPSAGDRDLSAGRRVGDLELDDGWGEVAFEDGRASHTLTAPDGRVVELWADRDFGCVQIYTSRAFPTETASDVAIAIEPMTAPADAFNTGESLRWLEPGEEWVASWGIAHHGF